MCLYVYVQKVAKRQSGKQRMMKMMVMMMVAAAALETHDFEPAGMQTGKLAVPK